MTSRVVGVAVAAKTQWTGGSSVLTATEPDTKRR